MPVMSTANGIAPYPKISGAKMGSKTKNVVLLPQEENSMKCSTCGMAKDDNPAHASDYSGPGKHECNYASSKSLLVDDSPIFFGGELKALGDGRLGGWAILFSDDKSPDLTNDYFDKDTDFFFEGEQKAIRPVLYDHGLDPTIKSRKIGRGTLEIKDAGVWFETEKALADAYDSKYIPYIQEMAEKGMLGLSTGSAPHLIQREQVGKAFHMKAWPIVEISLTPKPIEPRTKKAMALKSYADDEDRVDLLNEQVKAQIDLSEDDDDMPHEFEASDDDANVCDNCDETMADGNHASKKALEYMKSSPGKPKESEPFTRPVKSLFEEKLAERTQSVYELDRARDEVFRDIVAAERTSGVSGVQIDKRQKVTETVTEYAARLIILVLEQMQKFEDGDYDMSSPVGGQTQFYLRSFNGENPLQSFLSLKSMLESSVNLGEHSSQVVSAIDEYANETASLLEGVKSWIERCEEKIQFRANDSTKAGRTISAATLSKLDAARKKLAEALVSSSELDGHIGGLMELAAPKKSLDLTALLILAEIENEMAGVPSSVH